MRIFALVGKSGTGKSFRCLDIARENDIEAVIDDGLLISHSRIIAGKSAKHEDNKISSVKRAIFADPSHVAEVKTAISQNNIQSLLLLGTSDKMVKKIADTLELGEIEKIFYIEDIATSEEIELAAEMRNRFGKHIIPVPVFEVKKLFSGYFLSAFLPQGRRDRSMEKTIMRPTYSYLGDFRISPKVISDICRYEILKLEEIAEVLKIKSIPDANGYIDINIEVSLFFPCDIPAISRKIQLTLGKAVEDSTSIIVNQVNISVKSLKNV
ncbi:MAG: Asp23/Gls24 family envelope stress response protein [Clostridia bacterium]|nr:Asp23/Gls24 family envelope stress response protein [Clostridia bacterium]